MEAIRKDFGSVLASRYVQNGERQFMNKILFRRRIQSSIRWH